MIYNRSKNPVQRNELITYSTVITVGLTLLFIIYLHAIRSGQQKMIKVNFLLFCIILLGSYTVLFIAIYNPNNIFYQ